MEVKFVDNIRIVRKLLNKKQIEIANAVGKQTYAVSSWENGRTSPEFNSLVLLADYFGVPFDFLIMADLSSMEPINVLQMLIYYQKHYPNIYDCLPIKVDKNADFKTLEQELLMLHHQRILKKLQSEGEEKLRQKPKVSKTKETT